MSTSPTVLILGGGPAAMATAIALARSGINVLTAERARNNARRTGELLPPAAKPLLQQLGAWDLISQSGHRPANGIVSAWEDDEPVYNDYYFNPYGCGWGLDRQRFDLQLSLAAEQIGVEVHRQLRSIKALHAPSGWRVKLESEKQTILLCPTLIVDATGRSAWLVRRCGARRIAYDQLIAIMGTAVPRRHDLVGRRILLEAAEHGWWYSAEMPDDTVVAAYMTDADYFANSHQDPRSFWFHRLSDTHHTRDRLSETPTVQAIRVISANSYSMSLVTGQDWLSVGDAVMGWDPLTGQGIVKALLDGVQAAGVISEVLKEDHTAFQRRQESIRISFDDYWRTRKLFYGQVRRWPASLFWRRRQNDFMVEESRYQPNIT